MNRFAHTPLMPCDIEEYGIAAQMPRRIDRMRVASEWKDQYFSYILPFSIRDGSPWAGCHVPETESPDWRNFKIVTPASLSLFTCQGR